jgi:acyl dehydratase
MDVEKLVSDWGDAAEVSEWTSSDTLLYALSVGAGYPDPTRELAFTTENSAGFEQLVLPSYGVLVAQPPRLGLGQSRTPGAVLRAEQSITVHGRIAPSGRAASVQRIADVHDQGSGALVVTEAVATDMNSGEPLVTTRGALFLRGEGGFGGRKAPSSVWSRPVRAPDSQVTYQTLPSQALLYRLNGDRNPLHSDPQFATRAGHGRPILHGLCTFGFAGRALLHEVCESDPDRFVSMAVRFAQATTPGDELTVAMWSEGANRVLFQVARSDGVIVLDRGLMEYV